MSASSFARNPLLAGMQEIRAVWGWMLALGFLLMILGVVCVAGAATATFVTVEVFGWLLLFGGGVSLAHAVQTRAWSGLFLYLMSALLRGFTGYLLIRYPQAGEVSLTLILASFFMVGGLFRAVGSGAMKFPAWGWAVLSGFVSVALGIMLLAQMPVSSLWFIGFAIGLDMILDGGSLVGFAAALRNL